MGGAGATTRDAVRDVFGADVGRELLEMGPGSVLKLDRQVGEPIDLFLRGVRFATGHLVVVGDHLGVRIKEILATCQDAEDA